MVKDGKQSLHKSAEKENDGNKTRAKGWPLQWLIFLSAEVTVITDKGP